MHDWETLTWQFLLFSWQMRLTAGLKSNYFHLDLKETADLSLEDVTPKYFQVKQELEIKNNEWNNEHLEDRYNCHPAVSSIQLLCFAILKSLFWFNWYYNVHWAAHLHAASIRMIIVLSPICVAKGWRLVGIAQRRKFTFSFIRWSGKTDP